MKIELRNFDVKLTSSQETGELLVSGYVNKTGQFSQPLGREKRFVEQIKPGTFKRALDKGNDIHFLAEHDNAKLLASTKNGSLTLREDDVGLYMEAKISPTSWGKDYHQLISDGLLTNMSFGMQVANDKWSKRSDGLYERTIEEIYLAEVSVVRNPAYVQSTIQARSLEVTSADELFLLNQKTEKEDVTMEKTLKELRAQLEALEAQGQNEEVIATENRATENEVNETRGVELFLKGDMHAEEVRVLTTGTQSITVPTVLSNTIIEKLVEQAALFGRAKGFQPTSGTLEVLREKAIGGATFIGEAPTPNEASAVLDNNIEFDKVVLEQRRAATAIELTQQLINDSGINIVDYAVGVMTRRLSREMDKSVLIGDKLNKQFEGILTVDTVKYKDVVVKELDVQAATDADLFDALLDVTLSVHPDYLDNAVFVVNRPTFNRIAKLKDNDGRYQLVKDVVNGKPAYKILGHEILIQDHMTGSAPGEVSVAFVNFGVAYATMIKKGASMKRINGDTKNALAGTEMLMLDVYADGKILNEEAIKFIKNPAVAG